MKRLLSALLCFCTFDAMAAIDTSAIKNATTIDQAKEAYRAAVEKLITENESIVENAETDRAKSVMETNIKDADDAITDVNTDDDDDNADADGATGATSENTNVTKTINPADQERIDELQKKADAAHAREQSTANKLLGTAATALTGQGLSMALSGGAAASADKATEQEMKAYLQTFRCSFGSGTYKGGETDIELPTATSLSALKTEYMTLAAELKEMKTALGLKPGIESEEILDSATIGLHDDERHGIETGAFTSVSRALLDKDGEDAAAFNAQKSDAEKKAKTGTIMTGVGAVGGMVGNAIINKDEDKE